MSNKLPPAPWVWGAGDQGPEDEYGCRDWGPVDPLSYKSPGFIDNLELRDADGNNILSAGSGEYNPLCNRAAGPAIAALPELLAALREVADYAADCASELEVPRPACVDRAHALLERVAP
jgi:hypothetical protein